MKEVYNINTLIHLDYAIRLLEVTKKHKMKSRLKRKVHTKVLELMRAF